MEKPYIILSIFLLAIILLSTTPTYTQDNKNISGNNIQNIVDPNWKTKIPRNLDKLAGNPKIYRIDGLFNSVVEYRVLGIKYRRYLIIASSDEDTLRYIAENSGKLLIRYPLPGDNSIYVAYLDNDEVVKLAKHPMIYRIVPDIPFYKMLKMMDKKNIENIIMHEKGDKQLQFNGDSISNSYVVDDILKASNVWKDFGISGKNIVVGVLDTGVDFSNPELGLDAIARDQNGNPLIMTINNGLALFDVEARSVNETLYLNNTYTLLWDPLTRVLYTVPLNINLTVGNITSASGIYRVGMVYYYFIDSLLGAIIEVPVIGVMVDHETPGVYDRVYFDLSTAFYMLSTYMRELENMTFNSTFWREPDPSWLDYSIADEPWFGPGREIVARDFDGDGFYDFSIGTIAGYYLDTMGLVNATLNITGNTTQVSLGSPGYYRGWDYSGRFLALMFDYDGHGTSVATLIAGRGRLIYPIYSYGGKIIGVAPNATLAACSFWWRSDDMFMEAWMAGYEPYFTTIDNTTYIDLDPYGPRRADIISNSWGFAYVNFLYQNYPGTDIMTAYYDNLIFTRSYVVGEPVIAVFAAGNEGPGYGSISSPGAGLMLITVGASTSYKFLTSRGLPEGLYDDIIPFSSRGPNAIGYPKPDVVDVGAWEYAGSRTIDGRGYGGWSFELFGGTSEATPFTSGVLALVAEAYYKVMGEHLDPISAKIILKSSAKDLEYPAYMQGSGRVDAYKAVELVLEGGWIAAVAEGLANAFIDSYLNTYGTMIYNVTRYLYDTAYYGVHLPGSSKNFTLFLMGSGEAKISARELKLYKEYTAYKGVYDFKDLKRILIPRYVYAYSDYIEVVVLYKNLSYPSGLFLTTPIDTDHELSVGLLDWRDYNGDNSIDGDEIYFITEDTRIGVETTLSVSEPCSKIMGELVATLYPPRYPKPNLTPVEVEVVVKAYKYVEPEILSYPDTVYVSGYGFVNITVNIPYNARPGLHEIVLTIDTSDGRIAVPVSIIVPLVMDGLSTILLGGISSGYRYDPYILYGVHDLYSVWECKDWRMLPIMITDPSISGLLFIARWTTGYATDLSFLVLPPGGAYNEYSMPNFFASYKLSYDNGIVYNPSLRDQLHGKLRMYLPFKWSMPVRMVPLNILDLSDWPLYPGLYFIQYSVRNIESYGVYRVIYSLSSYSGSKIEERLTFRIISVKSSIEYVEKTRTGNISTGYIRYLFKASAYTPFTYSMLYLVTNSTSTYPLTGYPTYLTTSTLGNGTMYDMNYSVITYSYGYYLDTTLYSRYVVGEIPVVINVSDRPEIDVLLVMNKYPWHAEGQYFYNFTTYQLLIVEYKYLGIVTSMYFQQ